VLRSNEKRAMQGAPAMPRPAPHSGLG